MITNRIYEWALSQPTKPAFIFNDNTYTYSAFAHAIDASRRFFEQEGLPVGQTAIVSTENPADDWARVIALRALGLNTVCVQSVVAETLKLRNVACIVVNQNAPKLSGTSLEGLKIIVMPKAVSHICTTCDPPPHPEQALPFGGHILLTSGTTGTYKKVLLDGNYEDKRNAARAQAYHLNKNQIYYLKDFGPWTTIGFRMPSAVWHTGGCVVMDTRRDAFNNFFHYAIDLSILTPPMLKELIHSSDHGVTHNNCELLVTSGFLPIELAEETARHVTKKLGITYGSTELATPAMLSQLDVEGDIYWLALAPDRTIQIVDENGNECATGDEGELRIRLMDIDCASYIDDEEASARVFRNGFFCPGDMAVRRADGRVRILGRTEDVLNVQGRKIAAAPVELTIQRAIGVDEICLFSGLNDAGKDELVVVIQSDRELPRSVRDQIVRKFQSFEQVRFAYFTEFPRTTTGTRKIRRSALRKLVFPEH